MISWQRWNNHPVNLVSVFTGLYQVDQRDDVDDGSGIDGDNGDGGNGDGGDVEDDVGGGARDDTGASWT